LQFIKDLHKAMLTNIVTGDLGRAAEYARGVLRGMSQHYARFRALAGVADSVARSLAVLRAKTDRAFTRLCCRRFAPQEYANIVHAYHILDELARAGAAAAGSDGLAGAAAAGRSDGLSGLARRVQECQQSDLDSCAHSAMLEFIYASQQKTQRAAARADVKGAYSRAMLNAVEMMDLAEVSLQELYQLVRPEQAAACVIRSCEMFADVVHTRFLITQWHCEAREASSGGISVGVHRGVKEGDDDGEEDEQASIKKIVLNGEH
jgi:hypothetical protein